MKDVLKNLPPLVDTVTVKVANVTKYDDHQVEIREADTGSDAQWNENSR